MNNNQGICKFTLQLNTIWFDANILKSRYEYDFGPKKFQVLFHGLCYLGEDLCQSKGSMLKCFNSQFGLMQRF